MTISLSKPLALIDSDVLVYRVGFASQDKEEAIAGWRLDESIARMLHQLETEEYRCYLSSTDKSNFRYQIADDYKANRKQPKPIHYEYLRSRLFSKHMALLVEGQEADDALGIDSLTLENDYTKIICSIDKDMDQIHGWHFNFVKNRLYNISEIEGYRQFYSQLLIGDKATDNIEGCPGIGPVRANRLLEGATSEQEMFQTVIEEYLNAFKENQPSDRMWVASQLLWIRRIEGKGWTRHLSGEVVSKESLWNSFKEYSDPLVTSDSELATLFQKNDTPTLLI